MANSANPEINKKIATSALGTLVIATVFFYLGDRYAETLVTYPGQIFDHLSDAFLSMWQTIKDAPFALDMTSNSLLFGGACFLIIWMIWLRYVAFIGNYRSGEESGSARWGTLKEGKKFKDFCTFDADDGRNAAQSTVCKAFAATFDPKDPEGLVLYGKRGTGKSFHASCIANAVIERGFSCLVTDIKQVVNLMESSFEKRSGNLERILAPDLLILEDLGAQRSTEYVMEHVYDVIDGRYKAGKPMVITTNFDFRERILNATADDPWGRVFDRIVEVGFPVKYDGNSRRREIGMKNRKDFKRKLGIEGIES